ncbi:hypothetical protein DL764_009453 [Monosporascus ibericus]|uniref:Saccharopine dehydrogenase-like C-terminal domain-containing protein n=1 Tax=Monosporascus ibericus TaxID=155417 RepID=A0A4Q4SUY5_9PEZI|nr:hypothetical protein DL764_009453 [Monosporascus ibericus]
MSFTWRRRVRSLVRAKIRVPAGIVRPCVDCLFRDEANFMTIAIKGKTQVVSTSYFSPAIKELDGAAKEAVITVLNEVCVDPWVDHLYAIKVIGEVNEKGGKFHDRHATPCSLSTTQSSFLKAEKVVEIPNDKVIASAIPYYVMDEYSYLACPNRNSVLSPEFYQIPEVQTVIRGSLRYDGNLQLVKALIDVGWLDVEAKDWLSPR